MSRAPSSSEPGDRIRAGARSLDVELDEAAVELLSRFLVQLELWNARSNLVGEHERSALIDRHIVDALAAVPLLRSLGSALRIADVGSGAGLPGVPLAIALRPREMLLIEPRRKRASFLRNVRRSLPEVSLAVFEGRVEDVASLPASRGAFDAVVSRASLPDADLQTCASPLLRDGGLLVAYRGTIRDGSGGVPSSDGGFTGPVVHRYTLAEAERTFRLDVWTRCFT